MPRDHLSQKELEAYLNKQLSDQERVPAEAHLETCSQCRDYLQQTERLLKTLGPTLKSALGEPVPSPSLRHRLRSRLQAEQRRAAKSAPSPWLAFGRLLNTASMLVIILLLAMGVWMLVKPPQPKVISSALSATSTPIPLKASPTAPKLATPTAHTTTPVSLNTVGTKSFENLKGPENQVTPTGSRMTPEATRPLTATAPPLISPSTPNSTPTSAPTTPPTPTVGPLVMGTTLTPIQPDGLIAFSFFNPAPQRQGYEIHLIKPDGRDHHLFPVDNVSEPALRSTASGPRLAYRTWGEPPNPRSLLSSDLRGQSRQLVGGFWEDAHPDWSPAGDRLIYASQRESDRHWRLYTSQGDGQKEVDLGLAGQGPSFAPDGKTFVYQGCDPTGNQCGLWQANIEAATLTATPILTDPRATSPDWSPVASMIAYMARVDGNWDLYLVSSHGGPIRRLTTAAAIDGLPTWSPDGDWLAFLSNRGGGWGIWRLHLNTGELVQVFAFDGGTFTPPHGAPYGERNWWDEQLSWGR